MKNLPKKKIAILGVGHVGGTTAMILAQKFPEIEICLYDIDAARAENYAQNLGHDLGHDLGHHFLRVASTAMAAIQDADIVIIAASVPWRADQPRHDVIAANAKILDQLAPAFRYLTPKALVIMATNPIDFMVCYFGQKTGIDRRHLIGMAGVLDVARLRYFLAVRLGVAVQDVDAMIIGSHWPSPVVLDHYVRIGGVPIADWISSGALSGQEWQDIKIRSRAAGFEIAAHLENSTAYFAPAMAIYELVTAAVKEKSRLLTATIRLAGEHGFQGVAGSFPILWGAGGVQKIIALPLTKDEKKLLTSSLNYEQKLVQNFLQKIDEAPLAEWKKTA